MKNMLMLIYCTFILLLCFPFNFNQWC